MTILQVLVGAAITIVFVRGSIFDWVRGPEKEPEPYRSRVLQWLRKKWRELTRCPLCSGVWIGAAVQALIWGFSELQARLPAPWELALGIVGAGAVTGCMALLYTYVLAVCEAYVESHSSDDADDS